MTPGYSSRGKLHWFAASAVLLIARAAEACPGCKQAIGGDGPNGNQLSGTSIGFSLGVLFMIFMVTAVLGVLGRMMYRSCRIIAAQQAEAMADEEMTGRLSTAGPTLA